MNHPAEEQLILYYYGEDPEAPVAEHLAVCEACRVEYRKLQRILNTVETLPVPERPADYGAQVWSRLRAAGLHPRGAGFYPAGGFLTRQIWRIAAIAAVLLLAFLAGRYAQPPAAPQTAQTAPLRERILLVAVGDHLERSQLILAEVMNAEPSADNAYEQQSAAELVQSNRLFRLAAARNGDTATAALLDELERTLLEIAHSPGEVPGDHIGDLLFRVRVYATNVRTKTGMTL